MFGFSSSSFGILKFRKNRTKGSRYVARDDLDVKCKNSVVRGATKPLYCDMEHTSSYDNTKRGTVKVKVRMAKEEAMILLSKCDSRGTLSFNDVAMKLAEVPVGCVSLVCPSSPKSGVMLESIPEEM